MIEQFSKKISRLYNEISVLDAVIQTLNNPKVEKGIAARRYNKKLGKFIEHSVYFSQENALLLIPVYEKERDKKRLELERIAKKGINGYE